MLQEPPNIFFTGTAHPDANPAWHIAGGVFQRIACRRFAAIRTRVANGTLSRVKRNHLIANRRALATVSIWAICLAR